MIRGALGTLGLSLVLAAAACANNASNDGFADGPGSSGDTGASSSSGASSGGASSGGASSGGASSGGASSGGASSSSGGSSSGGPRIACGGTFCRSDQACTAGVCTFPCAGASVPGDYATVSAAVAALAATGADATICVKAQVASESVTVADGANHGKNLKIIGVSSDKSTISTLAINGGFANVDVLGLGVQQGATITGAKVTMRGVKLASTGSSPALWVRQVSSLTTNVTCDGCDIGGGTSGQSVQIDNSYSTPTGLSITNSYIHGGTYGVYVYGSGSQLTLSLVNDTIDRAQIGLYVGSSVGQITFVNDILSNHTQYAVYLPSGLTVAHGHNALFGNTNNYSGAAVDGAGYVKSDCMLDPSATGIPQTKPGSPCRGAADASKAPATDYWNAPRGAAIDIGAVQGS